MKKQLKVYKSSAGSGKTFTLVKAYLKLCLKVEGPSAFSTILAITFTNKATYEMKDRLMKTLKDLSLGQGDPMKSKLIEETGLSESDIKLKSASILTAILHNYADFSISTIDKFSHKIIRTFAKDLNLSMNFQVELEEKRLLNEVIGELVNEIGQNKALSEFIIAFAMSKLDEEKSWKVEQDLLSFSLNLLKEKAMPYLESLQKLSLDDFKNLENSFRTKNKAVEDKLTSFAVEGLSLIKHMEIDNSSLPGNAKISIYFRNVAELKHDNIFPPAQLTNNVQKDNWFSGSCSADQKIAITAIKEKLETLFYAIQELLTSNWETYLSRFELLKNIHSLALINQIDKRFAVLKQENALLNISDFNRIIADVVLDEPMPFIYERLGERYKHIMIDEFQDTSVLQFLNLLPLIDESLAKGNENLLVGDAKQAIYRFRGGEVDQFSEMPNYIPEIATENEMTLQKLVTLKSQYEVEELTENYRSAAAIVNFNNAFFQFVKDLGISEKINSIYTGHSQNITKDKNAGYVSLTFSSGKADELEEEYGDLMVQNIKQSLADGYHLKDIAVLCRKRKEASAMASRLKKESINVISSEALLLKNSAAVSFIINLLSWLSEPETDVYKKDIVAYLTNSKFLAGTLGENFKNYLSKNYKFVHLFDNCEEELNLDELKTLSILELIELFIRAFTLNKEYDVYLQSLQDVALDFTKTQGSDLVQFLNWWNDRSGTFSISVPEQINAVNVLTIHKSKGLEFPIVIYPFVKQEITHSGKLKDFVWVDLSHLDALNVPFALVEFNKNLAASSLKAFYEEELEKKKVDLINDTYVAFTRASERLYIHAATPPKKISDNLKLPRLLQQFLHQAENGKYSDESYEFGQLEKVNSAKQMTENQEKFSMTYLSAPWKNRLKISSEHGQIIINDEKGAKQYGDLIHEILAQIKDFKELTNVLKRYQLRGIINAEEMHLIHVKLTSLLTKEEVISFFDSEHKVRREATLLSKTGDLLRPDRVVYFKEKLAVIDFKTGIKNESHQQQVLKYCSLIAETTELPVKGYLLYTESEELLAV